MKKDDAQDARPRPKAHIRWVIRRDMPEMLEIEKRSFEFPWQEDDFIRALRQRNIIGMVAEINDKVVGYMIYELHKTRLHLLNMAVDPEYRHQGIGTEMIENLANKLTSQRRTSLFLEVREGNLPAQQFFRACGLKAAHTLRNFYDTSEDAYLMRLRHEAKEPRIVRAIERLESLTGTQWELAIRNGIGQYEPCELQGIKDVEHDCLVLRTRATTKNPKDACKSLNQLWHAGAYIDETSDKEAKVVVSVESLSPVWINRGKEGQLAGEFTASHDAGPGSLAERERKRKSEGHDSRGQEGRA